MKTPTLSPDETIALYDLLHDLALIADSFDQLLQIAKMGDLLWHEDSLFHYGLYEALEKTSRHLRRLPAIGANEQPLYCCPGGDCAQFPCPD